MFVLGNVFKSKRARSITLQAQTFVWQALCFNSCLTLLGGCGRTVIRDSFDYLIAGMVSEAEEGMLSSQQQQHRYYRYELLIYYVKTPLNNVAAY